jgi:hypothetical protein
MMTTIAFTLAMAVSPILGACARVAGPGEGPSPSGPDSPVSNSGPTGPAGSPGPLPVSPRGGLIDIRPHAWEKARVIDDRTVALTYYGGVEECYGLARVEVRYAPEAVRITLFEGRVPSAEVCIEIAVLKETVVALDEDLAGRDLEDGATEAG